MKTEHVPLATRNATTWTLENTKIETWFERDRAYVILSDKETDLTVWEAWDEDVASLVEQGFLDPKDWHGSALAYYNR